MMVIGLAGSAAVAGTAWAAPKLVNTSDWLTDLAVTTDEITDDARALIRAEGTGDGGTRVRLHVTGLDHLGVGRVLGAHVHTGTCVENDGAAAGGHYRHGTGDATVLNEVWLDFEVQPGGVGDADVVVPFEIPAGGAHSVVIHRDPTDPNTATGVAGPRVACIDAEF
jgi:Cu/Zn superoxide dismutase